MQIIIILFYLWTINERVFFATKKNLFTFEKSHSPRSTSSLTSCFDQNPTTRITKLELDKRFGLLVWSDELKAKTTTLSGHHPQLKLFNWMFWRCDGQDIRIFSCKFIHTFQIAAGDYHKRLIIFFLYSATAVLCCCLPTTTTYSAEQLCFTCIKCEHLHCRFVVVGQQSIVGMSWTSSTYLLYSQLLLLPQTK